MKRGKIIAISFFLFIAIIEYSSALGISPAIIEVDFAQGEKYEFTFSVISERPDQIVDIKVGGDLVKYVTLSEDKVEGSGSFNLVLKMPEKAERPGPNRISVILSQREPEEGFIGTKIEMRGTIVVRVPYPGRYLEADLDLGDGNIDSFIPAGVSLFNRGKENLYVNSKIDIYEVGGANSVYYLPFSPQMMEAGSNKKMQKFLNTSGMRPGNYFAQLVLDYGENLIINRSFRIGYLFLNITNYTSELPNSGIQKFYIGIESKWNGQINNIYADVNISNSTKNIGFRTPSVSLDPWKGGSLEGFIDTSSLVGVYNVDIALNYADKQSFSKGILTVYDTGINIAFITWAIIILIVFAFIIIIVRKFMKHRTDSKGNKR